MTTLRNIKIEKSDLIFSVTGFNYGISIEDNNDGTENIEFDSKLDADKFQSLLDQLQ